MEKSSISKLETDKPFSLGALAEALNLNQQITFDQTKERLQWIPKVTEFKNYIEQVEKELATAVR